MKALSQLSLVVGQAVYLLIEMKWLKSMDLESLLQSNILLFSPIDICCITKFIGIFYHFNCSELRKQKDLEDYLCKALKIKLEPGGEISVLKDKGYVLTLDFLLKMIAIHERQQSGVPVVITGETGVGKTFLLETLSELYNFVQQQKLNQWREKLHEFLKTNECKTLKDRKSKIKLLLSGDTRIQTLENVYSWFQKMQAQYHIVELFPLIEFLPTEGKIPAHFNEEVLW